MTTTELLPILERSGFLVHTNHIAFPAPQPTGALAQRSPEHQSCHHYSQYLCLDFDSTEKRQSVFESLVAAVPPELKPTDRKVALVHARLDSKSPRFLYAVWPPAYESMVTEFLASFAESYSHDSRSTPCS
jgi:hypothetical protein